jgi:hypothetical protein
LPFLIAIFLVDWENSGEKLPALGLLPNFDYEFFSRESAPHPFDRFFGAIRF